MNVFNELKMFFKALGGNWDQWSGLVPVSTVCVHVEVGTEGHVLLTCFLPLSVETSVSLVWKGLL